MQEQTLFREDNWQSPPGSKPEPMFINDKQSKMVRSSTAQCNDSSIQMQTGDLLQHQQITAQTPALRAHISTSLAIEANFNRCNGSPFVKTQRTCLRSH